MCIMQVYTFVLTCRQMLTYGRRIPLTELDYRIQQVDAKTVRDVCTRYIYDKCPVIIGIGVSFNYVRIYSCIYRIAGNFRGY